MRMNGSEYLWIKKRATEAAGDNQHARDTLALIEELKCREKDFIRLMEWACAHNTDGDGLNHLLQEISSGKGEFDSQNFPPDHPLARPRQICQPEATQPATVLPSSATAP